MQQQSIYIVLTGTETLFSQTIKWFTKAPLNHASISFDSSLKEVYSFGRKKVNNPFVAGLIKENFYHPFYHRTDCAVYRCQVDHREYAQIRNHVAGMMDRCDQYKYHLLGLIGVLINKDFYRENAYFCSHFVAALLEKTSGNPFNKPSCFVTPDDFASTFAANEIYRGKISKYLSVS